MDDPLAVALKFGFLAVLYLFLLWVSRSALRDLSRGVEPVTHAHAPAPPMGTSRERDEPQGGGLLGVVDPRLEVIAALGHEPGTVFDIRDGATLGRSDHAEIRVEDPFASSAHARIFQRGDFMHVEDMGSTNGTLLNGATLQGEAELIDRDTIQIGDTIFRFEVS